MISMPEFRSTWHGAMLAGILCLTGCSAPDSAEDRLPEPGSAEITRLLGAARSAMGTGELARAGQVLDRALALEPDNPAVWVETARLRYRGGEHHEALAAADRALAHGPQYGGALQLKAQLVRDAYGLAASLAWYEAGLAHDPGNTDLALDYAATLGDLGRYSAMLEALPRAADPRSHYLMAVLAARAGDAVLARSLLERSRMVDAGVPAALLLDALISMQQGSSTSAAEQLERLIQRQPDNRRARELLARALVMGGRDAEVVDRFGRDTAPAAVSPYLAMLVGRAHERLGERDKAAAWLDRAHAGATEQPRVLPVSSGLAAPTAALRTAALAGDWGGATTAASALRRRFPGSADMAALSGDAALGQGDARGALGHYAAATRVRRSWPLARKAIAAYRQLGDDEAADVLLIRHVAGDRNNIDALLLLSERFAAQGDTARAAMLLDHAAALGGAHDPAVQQLQSRLVRNADS
jgi:predicted Zn-dependent protease